MSAFPYVVPETIEERPVLHVPWLRLDCGFEAQIVNGVPVRVRYPLAKEGAGACSAARYELFELTGVTTSLVSRWEEPEGMVVVEIKRREVRS